jgi:hypothetical protein
LVALLPLPALLLLLSFLGVLLPSTLVLFRTFLLSPISHANENKITNTQINIFMSEL